MKRVYRKLLFLFSILFLLTSCYEKDIDDIKIKADVDPIYAFPLGKLSFILKDVIFDLDSAIKQYEDSLIYVSLSQPLFTLESDDMVTISDISTAANNLPVVLPAITDSFSTTLPFPPLDFGTPDDDNSYIDSILIKSAQLSISISSTDVNPARLKLSFPWIKRNNSTLSVSADLRNSDNYTNTINLGVGDKIDYTNDTSTNNISMSLALAAYGPRSISIGSMSISLTLSILEYSSVHGYFGRYTVKSDEYDIDMSVFQLLPENAQFFQEPAIRIIINNEFGFPVSFYFDKMLFSSTTSSTSIDLAGTGVPRNTSNAKIVGYPATLNDKSVKSTIAFTNQNSNIADALNMAPEILNIQTSTYVNQNGYTNQNFVKDENELDLSLEVELPLAAKIQEFTLGDTMPFSFGDLSDDLSLIKKVIIQNTVRNGFPTDGELKIGLLDVNYNLLKTLDDVNLLESGVVEDGKVVEASKTTPSIEIDQEIIQQFSNTSYLSYSITIKTSRDGNVWVKFYSYYDLKLTVGVKAELDLDINELN
ncbi:hypothetical protein ACFLTE_08735 [Bacteroidota bacterium]